MKTLILLAELKEAETDQPAEPGNAGKTVKDSTAKSEKDAANESDTDNKKPADTGTPPDNDGEDDFDLDDDEGEGGESTDTDDSSGSETNKDSSDTVTEKLRRERLYDAIIEVQDQAEKLRDSSAILIERIDDGENKSMTVRANAIMRTTVHQCEVLRKYFADLGYEKVRELYATARERVSAVTEIIKHVIDGDDDFSGNPTPEKNAKK